LVETNRKERRGNLSIKERIKKGLLNSNARGGHTSIRERRNEARVDLRGRLLEIRENGQL